MELVIKKICELGAKPGIVLHAINNYETLEKFVYKFPHVLVLCIDKVGQSGQLFQKNSYKLIKLLNNLNFRNNFQLCVDGGINIDNILKFNCEKIVSASNILNSANPKRKIMSLQTLSRYEKKLFKK